VFNGLQALELLSELLSDLLSELLSESLSELLAELLSAVRKLGNSALWDRRRRPGP